MRGIGLAAGGTFAVIAALVTSSCASTRASYWTNHNISEVIAAKGPPTEVYAQIYGKPDQPKQVLACPPSCVDVWMTTKSGPESRPGVATPIGAIDTREGWDVSASCLIWQLWVDGAGTVIHTAELEMPGMCPSRSPRLTVWSRAR